MSRLFCQDDGKRFVRARPQQPPGSMNKTEQEYALYLEIRKRAGEIVDYGFECYKLRLANRTFYTPDFYVQTAEGFLDFHEVKGFWEDDARVKIKVAAEQYPQHGFVAIKKVAKKDGGGWKEEQF